ncbi:WD40 repeat-like protein, partial [Basidiobolus meristosporus CBS 931.73]
MFLLKPDWIAHFGDKDQKVSIFSIDVHPSGALLATSGADGLVKIWNIKSLLTAKNEDDKTEKLCGTLKGHQGRVLCVRWSKENKPLLASGSDDHKVIVWECQNENAADSSRTWSIKKELTGHTSDVVDVSWSYDNKYLATSSLDKTVLIWDARTLEKIHCLSDHQGPVKGIAWDPAGKYIATQSDDNSVKIWRTTDWTIQKDITKPFANSTCTTLFRRLSWSPEGSHIAAANAMNGTTPVAAVISRDNWDSDISLVGHSASVEVVKFNPILFNCPTNPDSSSPEKTTLASICAIGSQDHSISVWVTRNPRPLAVAQSVFQHSVLDLCWSPDGLAVLGCSYDGSVVVLQFSQQELGTPIANEEKENYLAKYGYRKPKVIILDDPDCPGSEKNGVSKSAQTPVERALAYTLGSTDIITSTPQTVAEFNTSSTFNTPSISRLLDTPSTNSSLKSIDTPSHNSSQKVTLTKDGRRRIQPLFLGGVQGTEPQASSAPLSVKSLGTSNSISAQSPNAKVTSEVTSSQSSANQAHDVDAEEINIDPPSKATLKDGLPSMSIGIKRKEPPNGNEIKSKKTNGQTVESRPIKLSPYFGVSQIRLGVPRVKAHIVRHKLGKANFSLECHNDLSNKDPAKLTCTTQSTVNWTDYLPSPVISLTGNANFCAVTCEDGCLYVYTYNGKRLLPCMMLDAPVSFIDSCGDFLMCITAVGLLSVWNVTQQTVLISSVSLSPILLT